ncbi:MAG: hypothetical protein AAF615_05200 [Pseudomonadota bacterium]
MKVISATLAAALLAASLAAPAVASPLDADRDVYAGNVCYPICWP